MLRTELRNYYAAHTSRAKYHAARQIVHQMNFLEQEDMSTLEPWELHTDWHRVWAQELGSDRELLAWVDLADIVRRDRLGESDKLALRARGVAGYQIRDKLEHERAKRLPLPHSTAAIEIWSHGRRVS